MKVHREVHAGNLDDVDERSAELPVDRAERLLRARIEAGEWLPGGQLPSVSQLAVELSTSRTTITRVLQRLSADDVVKVVPHWGTFLAEGPGE
jgi:DNA-binding GntR family transcriptional regulator